MFKVLSQSCRPRFDTDLHTSKTVVLLPGSHGPPNPHEPHGTQTFSMRFNESRLRGLCNPSFYNLCVYSSLLIC